MMVLTSNFGATTGGLTRCPLYTRNSAKLILRRVNYLGVGVALHASVMQPWLASSTIFTYLNRVPCVTLIGGAFQAWRLRANSSSGTRSSIVFFTASTEMMSPSCTRAMGPPT